VGALIFQCAWGKNRGWLVAAALLISTVVPAVGAGQASAAPATSDPQGTIYVADAGTNAIDVFAPGSNGDVAPERVIKGPDTGISAPADVKVNAAGDVFVSNNGANSITEYSPGASGDASPICTIGGADTDLYQVDDMSLEPDGTLVVGDLSDEHGNNGAVVVIPPGACGDVAPVETIAGSSTGFSQLDGVGTDAAGTIFADSTNGNSIQVFPPGTNGNADPEYTISGAATGLSGPNDVIVGFSGQIYVTNGGTTPAITVFGPGAAGNATPAQDISGSKTDLIGVDDLSVDSAGNIYATDIQSSAGPNGTRLPAVLEWNAGATGDVAPNAVIGGATSTLGEPEGVFVTGPQDTSSAVMTTAATSASIALGTTTSDTATLAGGATAPTGSLVFKLFGPNDPACSNAPAYTSSSPVTVSGDGSYPSGSFTPQTAGTYSWQALYSGDAHNAALTSACGAAGAMVTVGVPSTTLAGGLIQAGADGALAQSLTVPAGTDVYDQASLSGTNAESATGTVTYNVYSDAACTTLVTSGTAQAISSPGELPASQVVTLGTPGTYYWQAVYSGDSGNAGSSTLCGPDGDVEIVQPGTSATSLSTTLSGGGQSGTTISVPAGTVVTDTATASGEEASSATGSVSYNVYSDPACSTLASAGSPEAISTPGTLPPSQAVTLTTPGTYYWQASYSGDASNAGSVSTCGTGGEVETVTAAAATTSVTTSLSGGGKSGASISVVAGTAVADTATLTGANASSATGTVTYSVYSNSACTTVAATAGTETVANGVLPGSPAVTLKTTGTYYWKAAYSGDSLNKASASSCGTKGEIETVTTPPPATSITTKLLGDSLSGAKITLPAGQPATDSAVLSGTNAAKATGGVTYRVYSDAKCTTLVATAGTAKVTTGKVGNSSPETLAAGTYYWTASYSGDASNSPSASACGSEVLTVKKPAGTPGTAPSVDSLTSTWGTSTATAHAYTNLAGDLIVAFIAANGPSTARQTATISGGGVTWYLISRQNPAGSDTEVWVAIPSGKLTDTAITVTGGIKGYDEYVALVAFKGASGVGPEAFASASTGAPHASLKTSAANAWVYAVGADWRTYAARTVGSGQGLLSQADLPGKHTVWVQGTKSATAASGTTVTINDTAPANDPYDLLLVGIQ
jgi:hypothetical protein